MPGSAAGNRTGMCSNSGGKKMFSRCGSSFCSGFCEFCEDGGWSMKSGRVEDVRWRVEDEGWKMRMEMENAGWRMEGGR